MNAFLYGVILQWKLDLRNKEILLIYYIVPLLFFAFMSGIFTSIIPNAEDTLIQSMIVFGVTMGAFLGAPSPLVELYGSDIKKSFKVGGIPLWVVAINNFISAFIHLYCMSLIILFIAPLAFNAKLPSHIPMFLLSLTLLIITCLTIGTILGLSIKKTSTLTITSQLLFLPSIMISGVMFPTDLLPSALQAAGKILPATWGFQLLQQNSSFISAAYPLGIISGLAIAINLLFLLKIGKE